MPRRTDARLCSLRCRQASWRARHLTIALIQWHTIRKPGVHRIESSWRFFLSRAAALAAAPGDGAVWSIVDVAAKPKKVLPDIGEIVWRTTPPLDPPYPMTRKGARASW